MVYIHLFKSLQGSKSAITMRFVPTELILSLFLLIQNFLEKKDCFSFLDIKISCINKQLVASVFGKETFSGVLPILKDFCLLHASLA